MFIYSTLNDRYETIEGKDYLKTAIWPYHVSIFFFWFVAIGLFSDLSIPPLNFPFSIFYLVYFLFFITVYKEYSPFQLSLERFISLIKNTKSSS